MKPTVTRTLCIAALAAAAGSAMAGGGREETQLRIHPGAAAEPAPARLPQHRGSGNPGTAVFHGADGMVIRFTVPGAGSVPGQGAAAEARPATPPASPQAPVGGGFTPEQ